MKKLFFKLATMVIIVFLFVFIGILPQYEYGFERAFIDKRNIAKSINGPKIILMGDSNVYYGIDSELIQNTFGMPVVNMGLHGALGQTFIMDLSRDIIGEGDIVIASPANFTYAGVLGKNPLAWLVLENHFDLFSLIRPVDYYGLTQGFPTYLRKSIDLWLKHEGNEYAMDQSRYIYNQYGDKADNGCINTMEDGWVYITFEEKKEVNSELCKYYDDYSRFCQSKGAELLIACAPIIEPSINGDYVQCRERDNELKSKLQTPFISESIDYVFPIEYFYDSNWHLNNIGRQHRTEQLICDLTNYGIQTDK